MKWRFQNHLYQNLKVARNISSLKPLCTFVVINIFTGNLMLVILLIYILGPYYNAILFFVLVFSEDKHTLCQHRGKSVEWETQDSILTKIKVGGGGTQLHFRISFRSFISLGFLLYLFDILRMVKFHAITDFLGRSWFITNKNQSKSTNQSA